MAPITTRRRRAEPLSAIAGPRPIQASSDAQLRPHRGRRPPILLPNSAGESVAGRDSAARRALPSAASVAGSFAERD